AWGCAAVLAACALLLGGCHGVCLATQAARDSGSHLSSKPAAQLCIVLSSAQLLYIAWHSCWESPSAPRSSAQRFIRKGCTAVNGAQQGSSMRVRMAQLHWTALS
ncbi:hypothetical protein COO60DRAFT_1547832, partial [Scenedesmus sp. NREL 46B-D3]